MPGTLRRSRDAAAPSLSVRTMTQGAGLALAAASLLFAGTAVGQTAAPAKHNNNTYGSPLDTMKSSRLWTDTPVPKAFVRESRPEAGSLDYTPLTGTDPERAKPRDAANVAALQAEMERAGARLAGRAPHPLRAAGTMADRKAAAKPRQQVGAASAD